MGCHPRTPTIFFGIVHFKDTHSRDPKAPCLAHGVQWYGWLGRHPRTPLTFFGIVHFKDTHSRPRNTLFLAHGVQRYGWLGCQPRTHTISSGTCISQTPSVGIQKHLVWPMVCCGMDCWCATTEPQQHFLALCISKTSTFLGTRSRSTIKNRYIN